MLVRGMVRLRSSFLGPQLSISSVVDNGDSAELVCYV